MPSTSAPSSGPLSPFTRKSGARMGPLPAIFWGGLACGVFDITQACIAWGIQNHLPPMRIFQSVAAGVLGRSAAQGGIKTAVLGGVLHFLIAFIWAAIYYLASRKLNFLLERPVLAGMLYGEVVWLVMNFAVVPLSAIHRWPAWTKAFVITGPIGHAFLVGLPIALAVASRGHQELPQIPKLPNIAEKEKNKFTADLRG